MPPNYMSEMSDTELLFVPINAAAAQACGWLKEKRGREKEKALIFFFTCSIK